MQTQMTQQGYDQQEAVNCSPTPAVVRVPLLVAQSIHRLFLARLSSPVQEAAPDPHPPHPNHHLYQDVLDMTK